LPKSSEKEHSVDNYLRYPVLSGQLAYMHHLIYLSLATRPLSAKALTCLVDQAWQANARQYLTGALFYSNKRFIQLLEGEQDALEAAYARIRQDPRHHHLCQVAYHPIAARRFAEWPLAFQTLSPAQFTHLAGCLAPTKSKHHFSAYGSAAPSFVEAMRALVQVAPAAKQAQPTT
jgi:hypothetical protein